MIDAREVGYYDSRHKLIRTCLIVVCLSLLGLTAIRTFGVQPTRTNTETVTVATETKDNSNNHEASILSMTSDEFADIHIGDPVDDVLDIYPESPGNIDNDYRTFWRRDRGGKYWVYWSHSKPQVVTRKLVVKNG